jgi:hypothetical protein
MSSTRHNTKTVYADRANLTAGEKGAIESLDAAFAYNRIPEGGETLAEVRRSLVKETYEALKSAIPDLEERGRAQRERIMPELDRLKGTALQQPDDPVMRRNLAESIAPSGGGQRGRRGGNPFLIPIPADLQWPQPPNVGELWKASVSGFSSEPNIFYDIDHDPLRIFGHLEYSGDALLEGSVGVAMTFTLPPERMWIGRPHNFAVDPELRMQGSVSGYTGYYHSLFAADDKWCRCWESTEVDVTLSSGEWLAGASEVHLITDLQNEYPVGQSNDHRVYGWFPGPLRFSVDMDDLRFSGVSLILRAELRYDFQLEGESDLWLRSWGSESEPAFDNALTFRCKPYMVSRPSD